MTEEIKRGEERERERERSGLKFKSPTELENSPLSRNDCKKTF
jgi:hypothetical protein